MTKEQKPKPKATATEKKRYWMYDEQGLFTGEVREALEPPENGSPVPVYPQLLQPGEVFKVTEFGWAPVSSYAYKTLEAAKQEALEIVQNIAYTPLEKYPDVEVATFSAQLKEAQAYAEDDQTQAPLLALLAEASGRTVDDLAAAILVKHEAEEQHKIRHVELIQKLRRIIKEAKALEDIPDAEALRSASIPPRQS